MRSTLATSCQVFGHPAEDVEAVFGPPHLAHAEHDGDLDVLALVEELARPPGLGIEVVDG
jgi:hypothetical protein